MDYHQSEPCFLHSRKGSAASSSSRHLKPFAAGDIKVFLLENVSGTAPRILEGQGYQIEFSETSIGEEELIEKARDAHIIGIRSKTKLTPRVINQCKNLVAIGCFCIGTNQVDVQYAAERGVAVFNSPFSNSRSVAELIIAELIALARQWADRSMEMHQGTWNKVSKGCWEVRGKTLGIIGYGHIGKQLSVLAEGMGMSVVYHDVQKIMALGTARQTSSLEELLAASDFVTCHVPASPETAGMIGEGQFALMRDGSYILNASRGTVVDIPALIKARRSGKIAGAALDVYPQEPASNGRLFTQDLGEWAEELRGLQNVILTPHIGGSTEEAQSAIGVEVASALTKYVGEGTSLGAVNLPHVALRSITKEEENRARVVFIHRNVPGALRKVNEILADHNVDKQMTDSRGDVAYLMTDISDVTTSQIKDLHEQLTLLEPCIKARILY